MQGMFKLGSPVEIDPNVPINHYKGPTDYVQQSDKNSSPSIKNGGVSPDAASLAGSLGMQKQKSSGADQASTTRRKTLVPRASFYSQAEIFDMKGKREEEEEHKRYQQMSEGTPLRDGEGDDQEGQHDQDEVQESMGEIDGGINQVMILWENVLHASIIYNCVTFCYFLGLPGFPQDAWLYLEFIVEILMIIDIFIRYVLRRFLVNQRKTLNLLHSKHDDLPFQMTMFILSSFPTSIIIYPSIEDEVQFKIWLALIRGVKLYRIKQLNLYYELRDIRAKKDSFIRTFQATLYILLVTHLLSCFWLFIARVDPQQDLSWQKLVLYDEYEGQVTNLQKYIDSVFFVVSSMTGLGFAYIYPRTDLEYAMQSMIMVLGVSTYANFFAFFAVTIYNRNKSRIDNMMRFEEAKKLAMLRGFPHPIRLGIREFYNNLRLKFESMTSKFQMMQELPSSLRSEMSLYLNTDLIQKINFFQFADPSLILKLSEVMYPELGLMDSFVVQQGEVATSLYFIKSGIVQVLATDKKTVIALMTEGGYFGEIGLFLTSKRSCSIRAKTVSVFFTIQKDALLEALKEFPLHLKYLKAVGKQRLKTTDPQDIMEEGGNQNQMAIRLQQEVEIMKRMQDSKGDFEIESPDQGDLVPHQLINGNDQSALDEVYELETKWYLTESFKDVEHFVIVPFSKLFIIWNTVFCIAYAYDALFVPFSIGLDYEMEGYSQLIDIASLLIMVTDSGLRPFLAINKRNEIEVNRKKLFREYVQLYFIIDVLASVPLDYLFMIIEITPIMKYFRLLRLLKIYRIFELSEIIRQHTTLNIPVFRISLLFVAFIFIAHWFTCILVYAARWELFQGRRFDGKTLLEWMQRNSSSRLPQLDKWTPWDQYFNLLILATCYMGSIVYGDIIPFTISEEVISIFEMLIGRIFISFLFAEMANYVSQQWSAYDEHVHQQGIVRKWTQLNGINKDLRNRIQKYFDFKWHNKKGIREDELIQDLPTSLKKNVKNYIFDDLIQNCDVFPRESVGAISTITEKLQRKLIPKDEFIIRQGELAQEMFFILKGEVRIVTQEGVTLATLKKHMHFGEMALIQEQISVRNTSAVANNNVICAILTVNDFKLICTHYPEFKTRMQEIVEQRAKDSLQKGVRVTNHARRPTVKLILQNLSVNRGITQSDFLVHQSTNKPLEDGDLNQLSMIEEESKRYSVADEPEENDANFISPRTIHSARKKQAYKRRQSEFGLKKKVCVTRLSQIEDSSDTSEEESEMAVHPAGGARSSQKKKKKKAKKQTLESDQPAFPKVDQNQVDDDFEASSNTHSSYLSDSERKSNDGDESDEENNQDGRVDQNTQEGQDPITEQDQLAQNRMFESFDSFNPKSKFALQVDQQLSNKETINSHRSENLKTTDGLLDKKPKEAPAYQNADHPGKLNSIPQIGSSMSQLEEYMQQFRGSQNRLKISFLSMFYFYAYKYILVFPLSLYNIIFIPLQMGFGYEFKGWYLFVEILTIITYTVDIFFIFRHYISLKREMKLAVLPIGSQEFEERLNHDKDEVEIKLKSARLDLACSILAMIPFSLIFQGVQEVLYLVNFLRMLRLIKLQPLYRVLNFLKRYSVSLIRLLEIIIAYYVVAHIVACVMLSVGYAQKHDVENTWMRNIPIPLPQGMPRQTDIDSVDHSTVYIHAIYFSSNTISHVAVGDLTSVSTSERALNTFIIWCLTFFYSLLFANISSVFSGGNYFLSFNQKYQHVLQSIPKEKLKKSILNKINIYYEHLWSITQGFDEENDILRPLPSQIMYEAFRERYLEAIENSIIFKTVMGTTDLPVLNSFIELVQLKIFMPREFIIKAGSYGNSLYFILEGDAVMIGLGDDIFGILKSGSHFNIDIGSGDNTQDIYYGKRIFHLVSRTQTTVAVLEKENLKKLFDAFPYWKTLVRKLNYQTHQRAKLSLEEFLAPIVRLDPYCDEFKIELETIEKHLNESGEQVYKDVLKLLDLKEHHFIEDQNTHKFRKNDILRLQRRMLEQDGNINKHGQGILKQTKALQKRQSMTTQIQFVRMSTVAQNNPDLEDNKEFRFSDIFSCFLFHRVSKLRTLVDFLHMCNLIYIAFSVPFFIAFSHSVDTTIFLSLEIISIIIQFAAIFVNFRTPVFYYGGYTLDIKPVFRHYLLHGMIYDIFGVLPINLVLGYLSLEEPSVIFISLVRLTRMIALGKLVNLFEKLQIYLKNYSIMMVVCRAILFLCLLWHWTSCLWFFINVLEYNSYPVTWLKQFSVNDKMLSQQYLLAMYYVIKIVTGVGQSDMIAYNNLERIAFILIINIGDALFAIAFGLFAEVQHHIFENSEFQQYLQKLKEVEHFLVSVNAEDRQRSRVESFFQYNYNTKRKQLLVEVKDLKAYLPYSLLNEVIFSAYKDILSPVFNELKSENLMKELSIVLQNTTYMPGDYIIQTDQEGDEMYFILEGFVQVISSDQSTVLSTLSKGQCFGEISIFMKIKRIAFVQAKTFCIISILKKKDIDKIILSYPSIQLLFKKQAKQRLEETLKIEEQRFNRAKQQEQDSFDESFGNALMHANGNSNPDDVSDHTDNTHMSLVNVMKQNAGNQPELNNFIQRVSQSRTAPPNKGKIELQIAPPPLTKESSIASSIGSPPFRLDSQNSVTMRRDSLLVPFQPQMSRRGSQRKSILMIPPPPAGTLSGLAFHRKLPMANHVSNPIEVTPFISVEEFKPGPSPRHERRTFEPRIIQEDDEATDLISIAKGEHNRQRKRSKSIVQSPNDRRNFAAKIQIQEVSSSSDESSEEENKVIQFLNDSLSSHQSKKSSKDRSEKKQGQEIKVLAPSHAQMEIEADYLQHSATPSFLNIPGQQRSSAMMRRHSSFTRPDHSLLMGDTYNQQISLDDQKFIKSPPQRDSSLAPSRPRLSSVENIEVSAHFTQQPEAQESNNPPHQHFLSPNSHINRGSTMTQLVIPDKLKPQQVRPLSASRRNTVAVSPNVMRDGGFGEDLLPQKLVIIQQMTSGPINDKRRQSVFLFKQAMETIQEDPSDSKSGRARGTAMRMKSKKPVQRRLSKIQLGKNLMLSKSSGLKLQWTVGF